LRQAAAGGKLSYGTLSIRIPDGAPAEARWR